ncbi:MAG TPA: site-specific DNA-methyltransferase, partial [Actinomycetes bacterium]|nr:site-specific DNA-methyltransferase [Actinomycetes bacterium]
MPTLDAESIDAIVTDPPYGLSFMGKHWDHGLPGADFWREGLRIAKPGAYLLAFGGTRTVHRLACAIEDAGWIIRDMLVWGYASGFPKGRANLKPAWEPIVMARKPGKLQHLNIDECRIEIADTHNGFRSGDYTSNNGSRSSWEHRDNGEPYRKDQHPAGRWPANVILTDPIFDGGWDGVVGGGETGPGGSVGGNGLGSSFGQETVPGVAHRLGNPPLGDSGTYSRFFLIPKAARSDREPVLGGLAEREPAAYDHRPSGDIAERLNRVRPPVRRANVHPTVKPTDLMRHLVRLVTPPGGTVLD